jgi:Skp family chaperone for outer membrane proteins
MNTEATSQDLRKGVTQSLRQERNKRYYQAKKIEKEAATIDATLPETEQTLLAKRRDIDTQLAELRHKAKSTHVIPKGPEGDRHLAQSKAIVKHLIRESKSDWQLLLMVSEDLRRECLKANA